MSPSSSETNWEQVRSAAAAASGASTALVHPEDMLWHFIAELPFFPEPEDVAGYYFSDGAESARKLAELIGRHRPGGRIRLLEFASGYGMVTRHLRNALPDAELLACDIHPAAIEFVEREVGVPAIRSEVEPEDVRLPGQFDVVFALSFFSHMPDSSFGRWLGVLHRAVAPGGILIFTTHGLASAPNLDNPEIPESGIWFRPSSEQHDLDTATYGSTLSTPEYVIRQLWAATQAPIAEYRYGYWWQHQDLWVVAKPGTA